VAGAPGGGAGAFDWKQLLQMLPLIFARNQGARAAFLAGWQKAQQQDEQRQLQQQQVDTQRMSVEERTAERRAALEQGQQDRDAAGRRTALQAAQAFGDKLAAAAAKIPDPQEMQDFILRGTQRGRAKFGDLWDDGMITDTMPPMQTDPQEALDWFKLMRKKLPNDEDLLTAIDQYQGRSALERAGKVATLPDGTRIVASPDAPQATGSLTSERQAAALRAEARELKRQGKGQEAAAKNAEADAITQDMRAWNIGSKPPDPTLGATGGGEPITMAEVPPEQRQNVQALLDYKAPLSSYQLSRSPMWQEALKLARRVDPTFDLAQFDIRKQTRVEFTSGRGARTINALNTAVGHLESLDTSATALKNANWQIWNLIKNFGLKQSGDPRVVRFDLAANAVSAELATVFKNTGATDQEIKAWRNTLSDIQSPEQLNGAIDQAIELLGSRLEALHNQYEQGMGRAETYTMLSEKSRKILEGLGIDVTVFDPGTSYILGGKVETAGPSKVYLDENGNPIRR